MRTSNSLLHLFKTEHSTPVNPKECLTNIKRKIAEKSGISKCIDIDETSAAFSGTKDDYDLYISISTYKKRGKECLSVYVEDHVEWDEHGYRSQEAFEDSVVEYICDKINRTIRTITKMKRHKYIQITEYELNQQTNEWILMSVEKTSWLIIRPFITEDSLTEEIKEYRI